MFKKILSRFKTSDKAPSTPVQISGVVACPQFDFIFISEHGTGKSFLKYLSLFDDFSLLRYGGPGLPVVKNPAKYNGINISEITSQAHYANIIQAFAKGKNNVCVLTRDPISQTVSSFNFLVFLSCLKLVELSSKTYSPYIALMESSSRSEYISKWVLRKWSATSATEMFFTYRLLPFLKESAHEVFVIDTSDVRAENVYSTMDVIKNRFFNSEIDYRRVEITTNAFSVYTGGMFFGLPLLEYSANNIEFALRPTPFQNALLDQVKEHMLVSYKPEEIEWTCGKFHGDIAFVIVPRKKMSQQELREFKSVVKKICDSDDKKFLREYSKKTSFRVNIAYTFYDTLKTTDEEVVQIIGENAQLFKKIKDKIYCQAAALNEFGYDATKKWPSSAKLLGGTEIMLTEEHENDHLHAVIKELKEELLRQGREIEKLTLANTELEKRIKDQESAHREEKPQHESWAFLKEKTDL